MKLTTNKSLKIDRGWSPYMNITHEKATRLYPNIYDAPELELIHWFRNFNDQFIDI